MAQTSCFNKLSNFKAQLPEKFKLLKNYIFWKFVLQRNTHAYFL